MEIRIEKVEFKNPQSLNVIIGQSHFIKTVEDMHEALAGASSGIKFGLAFCEASQKALVRTSGNDKELENLAQENALRIGAGHMFVVVLKNAFPINVLNSLKMLPEVCRIYCASANPLEVIVAETGQGRAVLGVVDGVSPKGVENEADKEERHSFLRQIGYKL